MLKYIIIKIRIFFLTNRELGFLTAAIKTLILPLKLLDKEMPKKGNVLDIGCGEGLYALSVKILRPNMSVTIIDSNKDKLKIARKISRPHNSITASFENIKIEEKFDFVISNDFMHHINYEKHNLFIKKVKTLLNINGKFFFKDVNQSDYVDNKLTKFFDLKIEPELEICFREKNEWVNLIKRCGLSLVSSYQYFNIWVASRTVLVFKKGKFLRQLEYVDKKKINQNIIFITGGSGFIGSHLINYLSKNKINGKNNHLIVMMRNPEHSLIKIKNCSYLYCDFDELENFKNKIKKIDYVFHFAAEVKFNKPVDPYRHNEKATKQLIDFVKNFKIKKFILGSTLGALERGWNDNCSKPLNESSKGFPKSTYGISKLKSEKEVINSKLPFNIIRIPWAYGSNMTLDTHLRYFFEQINNNKILTRINFVGKVSIIHIDDLLRSILIVSEKSKNKEIFHVSDSVPISLGDIFSIMHESSGKKSKMINVPKIINFIIIKFRKFFPTTIQSLSNDVLVTSNNKIERIGFKPEITARVGIKKFYRSLITSNTNNQKEPVTLITGSSSGLGKELYYQLRQKGHRIISIDRDNTKNSNIDHFIQYDLSNLNNLEKIISIYLKKYNYYIENLINNAGVMINEEFNKVDLKEATKLMRINCDAYAILCNFVLRQKINERINIINISSSSSFSPIPKMSLYTASKAFINQFTLSLMAENSNEKINISLIIPGGMNTGFQKKYSIKERKGLLNVSFVAEKIIKNIQNPKKILFIGSSTYILYLIQKMTTFSSNIKLTKLLAKKFL